MERQANTRTDPVTLGDCVSDLREGALTVWSAMLKAASETAFSVSCALLNRATIIDARVGMDDELAAALEEWDA